MWPYTTCLDRNKNLLGNYTNLDYYFNATIYDPGYLIHRKKYSESDSIINLNYNRYTDYVNFSYV
jgi:hypothetical protein